MDLLPIKETLFSAESSNPVLILEDGTILFPQFLPTGQGWEMSYGNYPYPKNNEDRYFTSTIEVDAMSHEADPYDAEPE